MTILGMDLSLNGSAFAIVEYLEDIDRYHIVNTYLVDNRKAKTHGEKLYNIGQKLNEILSNNEIDIFVREKGFTRFNKVTQALYKAVGLVDYILYLHKIPNCKELPPTTIKKIVTGSGKASKEEVEKAIRKYIKQSDYEFKTNDESDAVAVAISEHKGGRNG